MDPETRIWSNDPQFWSNDPQFWFLFLTGLFIVPMENSPDYGLGTPFLQTSENFLHLAAEARTLGSGLQKLGVILDYSTVCKPTFDAFVVFLKLSEKLIWINYRIHTLGVECIRDSTSFIERNVWVLRSLFSLWTRMNAIKRASLEWEILSSWLCEYFNWKIVCNYQL